ncbi:NAD+ synthase [Thermogladius sp. 4427co]|uniref:NAD+ synthase n=1 Tax=Thermogladius sp. 4427co TaxID=3450718 RepID=UPI003F79D21F
MRISLENILDFPLDKTVSEITEGLRSFVRDSGAKLAVIGLSGGLDSSVTATLLAKALPREMVLALVMPDTRVNKPADTIDAIELAESLGIKYYVIPIDPIVNAYMVLPNIGTGDRLPVGNLRARIRMNILYLYANKFGGVVIGTGDRSEILIGYFTKYGDGGVDFQPVASLYKTQLRALARYLGLPDRIVEKPSSPGLWESHLAEEEIGLKYEDVDRILYALFDMRLSVREASEATGLPLPLVEKVLDMHRSSRHKRKGLNYLKLSWVENPLAEI